MNFTKVIKLSQPENDFQQIELTRAQIEEIEQAGQHALLSQEIRDLFHISVIRSEKGLMENESAQVRDRAEDTKRELQAGGPIFFVISVKEHALPTESIYLYTGMMMAAIQLQATDLLLGYSFSAQPEKIKHLNSPDWENRLGIPHGFSAVQIVKIGYPEKAVDKRVPYLGNLLSRVLD